jgi:hypothetical protein
MQVTQRREALPMKDWQLFEQVIELIEKQLDNNAVVERNVNLPDLSSGGKRKRQCDLVIRYGQPPRQTISIVEVQKRERKVDLNMFQGWCQKMVDVGAQHLICVSQRGFPKSIIEKAKLKGPTVRLMTVSSLEHGTSPINIFRQSIFGVETCILKYENVRIGFARGEMPSKDGAPLEQLSNQKTFQLGEDPKLLSLDDLTLIKLAQIKEPIAHEENYAFSERQSSLSASFVNDPYPLYLIIGNAKHRIKLDYTAELITKVREAPIRTISYSQHDVEDPLAWLMEGCVEVRGQSCNLRVALFPMDNGDYRARLISFDAPNGTYLEIVPIS